MEKYKSIKMTKKIILITMALSGLLLSGCSHQKVAPPSQLVLAKTSFANLNGWQRDNQIHALRALQKSCVIIKKRKSQASFYKKISQAGSVADWQGVCSAIDSVDKSDVSRVREFFESQFEPYHVYNNGNPKGLFTGYYLPTLNCRYKKSRHYRVPVHAIPADWVKINLGMFDERLRGRTFVGQVKDRTIYRYPERKNILKGKIAKNSKIIVWCDDKVDVAFAQIQGSAIVKLPNKKKFLIGYEGSNGRSYTSLGKVLIKRGELTPQNNSMQAIRRWCLRHPKKVDDFLNQNASYVFFRVLATNAPLGAEQTPLTSGRSLAVDRRYIPYGVPVWLDTVYPDEKSHEPLPLQRLFIAQDTGGAIKGVVRGDVYWGGDGRAASIAGNMKSQGEYWLLLPKTKK